MEPRVICLTGPTASGKSAIALALAESLQRPAEIVSVDSALVYRGMDIGTAKPSVAQRAAVQHHLIDIIEPTQSFSAARFVTDARRLIAEINAREHVALLVGGTMLYFKALIEGLDILPPANPALRAELETQAAARGWPQMHAELARIDPITAARLAPTDAHRIQRALEVFQLAGRPISSLHGGVAKAGIAPLLVALEPLDRAWLHGRIATRFHAMLAAGLVDEVRALRARGDLHTALPAMRCVGYRQTWEALERGELGTLAERAIAATRQLAKRQLTWLRAMPLRTCVACDAADAEQRVIALARRVAAA